MEEEPIYEMKLTNGIGEQMLAHVIEQFDVELKQTEFGPKLQGTKDELEKAGFELKNSGGGTWQIESVCTKWSGTEEDLKKLYDSGIDPLDTIVDAVEINSIEHLFNESTPYQPYQQNTLYNFQISKIAQQAVFKITALLTEDGFTEALETKEIAINNTEGSGLKYNLEIVNGDQTYMYDAGGKAPKITIRPLSYRLYDKGGALVFDSAGEDSELVVTKTKPQWNFYRTSTLLTTKYSTDLSMQYRIDTDFSD